MKEWRVGRGEKDQRFNKYLQRKLPDAPSSFLYKMLRKSWQSENRSACLHKSRPKRTGQ